MATKASEARKILFNLTQKYCVGNLKRHKKTVSSSSHESSEDDLKTSPVSRKNSEKNQVKSLSNSAPVKSPASEISTPIGDKVGTEVDRSVEDSVSEIGSVISGKSAFDEKLLLIEPPFSSESIYSSVDTDSNADNNSVVEEFSDVASDSSAVNVFANVHLLSDDVLEEIESNVRSDHSFLEDERSNRLSVVHSIKSIQLGSPLNLPNVGLHDYESDFEDSDVESVKSELEETVQSNNNKVSKEPDGIPALTLNEYVLDKPNTPSSTDTDSEIIENTLKSEEAESDDESSSTISRDESYEESLHSATTTEVSDDERDLSSSNKYESKKEVPTNVEHVKVKEGLGSKSFINNNVRILKDVGIENSIICLKKDVSINTTLCNSASSKIHVKTAYVQTNNLIKSNYTHECFDKCCNTNFNINKSTTDAGIQTDNINIPDKLTEERFSCRKPKKIYIDTSVESTEFRPFINACSNKFCPSCGSNVKDSEYNPYTFTSQVADGAHVEEVCNEMLRNQIAMTRHFMDCHHRLYIQCCQTVQNMNEQYKKSKLCFIIT